MGIITSYPSKMRVLFLSASNPFPKANAFAYGGGGWITSLIRLVKNNTEVKLGVVYATNSQNERYNIDDIKLFPVYIKSLSVWGKLRLYYGDYKHQHFDDYINGAQKAIENFRPDIIHLFGLEGKFAHILGHAHCPIVCHLQGILPPIANAFFPSGMSKSSLLWPFSVREWILRNGYLYSKKSIQINGEEEILLFHELQYAMGRTEWDYEVSQLLAPKSKYFHVDEVLRQPFYDNAGKWQVRNNGKLAIVSTLSETIYKGLDLVLKTAKLLKEETSLDFEWNVIGIGTDSNFVKFFERNYGIKSSDVNINYLGVKKPDEIIQILLNATVYVHTSYIDNSPNSVCEAQMIGCPVIATNVGGVSSLVKDGKTGFLVPANAPFELTYKLKTLANDAAMQKKLSDNEKTAAAKRHDKQTIAKQLIDTYKAIVNHE